MRTFALAIALLVVTGCVACAGEDDEAADALTMEQRVLLESEVPGSKPGSG